MLFKIFFLLYAIKLNLLFEKNKYKYYEIYLNLTPYFHQYHSFLVVLY